MLPAAPVELYLSARLNAVKIDECVIPARDARCFLVPRGHFFRITSVEGPQVGDLNLWNSDNFNERFYSGKTRALHGSHITEGERMWSGFPALRPMATIVGDSLNWYGIDEFGGSVHDVIGTRCDPYTNNLLSGGQYHHCCHSNLTRAFSDHTGIMLHRAEHYIHDVLNVFMCTGFTRDTGQYFMKASPVRPETILNFFLRSIFWVRSPPVQVVIVRPNIQVMLLAVIRLWLKYLPRRKARWTRGLRRKKMGITVRMA